MCEEESDIVPSRKKPMYFNNIQELLKTMSKKARHFPYHALSLEDFASNSIFFWSFSSDKNQSTLRSKVHTRSHQLRCSKPFLWRDLALLLMTNPLFSKESLQRLISRLVFSTYTAYSRTSFEPESIKIRYEGGSVLLWQPLLSKLTSINGVQVMLALRDSSV